MCRGTTFQAALQYTPTGGSRCRRGACPTGPIRLQLAGLITSNTRLDHAGMALAAISNVHPDQLREDLRGLPRRPVMSCEGGGRRRAPGAELWRRQAAVMDLVDVAKWPGQFSLAVRCSRIVTGDERYACGMLGLRHRRGSGRNGWQRRGFGTADDHWILTTPPGKSQFEAWHDPQADPPALVVQVGSTQLRYQLHCVEDLHAMLRDNGGWVPLVSRVADSR